jgi:glycosyltransferase involved in cell wall biosynthesis
MLAQEKLKMSECSSKEISVSVVLATYNPSENFLFEQVNSILDQSRVPNEIIISDDASPTDVKPLVERLTYDVSPSVVFVQGRANVGYSENFLNGLACINGDIIFFADQDDVWFSEKVERILKIFEFNKSKFVIVHDQVRANSDLVFEGLSTLQEYRRKGWSSDNLVHGCATAIRAEILPLVLQCPAYSAYDEWVHFIGDTTQARLVVEERLMAYRRHENATTIINPVTNNAVAKGLWDRASRHVEWRNQSATRDAELCQHLLKCFSCVKLDGVPDSVLSSWTERANKKLKCARCELNVLNGSLLQSFGSFLFLLTVLEGGRRTQILKTMLSQIIVRLAGRFCKTTKGY